MLNVVIFAAGNGTRMQTELPKVLHTIAGRPMLALLIDAVVPLKPSKIIITCSYHKELVQNTINNLFPQFEFVWVEQQEVSGTGQAMKCVLPYLECDADCLVMCGDMPFIQDTVSSAIVTTKVFKEFIDFHQQSRNLMTIMSNIKHNPAGYGRILRQTDPGSTGAEIIVAIREQKNLTAAQHEITETNTGVYIFNNQILHQYVPHIQPDPVSGEYYLTDIVEVIRRHEPVTDKAHAIGAFVLPESIFFAGANNQLQLVQIERKYQLALAVALLNSGVRLYDINRIDIRGSVSAGTDCTIDVNCIFSGQVVLGDNVQIGAGCYLKDVRIASNVVIKPYSIVEDADIADEAQIGPFARIRPGTTLAAKARIGNFVEIKNSQLGVNTKVNHLTYVGDAKVGRNVNIGAGVVCCNYDGVNKHQTEIGDDVFVGSGTMLVAPLTIGAGALIAAGSTINKNAPANELTIARAPQETRNGWLARRKGNK